MVTSEDEITRRIEQRDSERSARRAQVATIVGQLAGRHAELAGQLAELERDLGKALTEAGDVIDVAELAQVTDIPVTELTRWREHAAKPGRNGKRARPRATTRNAGESGTEAAASRATRIATPVPTDPVGAALGAASS